MFLILRNVDFQLFPVEELEESFNFMRVCILINKMLNYLTSCNLFLNLLFY